MGSPKESFRSLRTCWELVLDLGDVWVSQLALVEFAYNNRYQASIQMAPFETLYGRKCNFPICWDHMGERKLLGPELVQQTIKKIWLISLTQLGARKRATQIIGWSWNSKGTMFSWRCLLQRMWWGKLSPRFVGLSKFWTEWGIGISLALPPALSEAHNVLHIPML